MAEPTFIPKEGQVDYTNIRYCPVVNCVVRCGNEIMPQHRSPEMRIFPDLWSGISGFLDTDEGIEDKIYEELLEEAGIPKEQVRSVKIGPVLRQEDLEHGRTWLVVVALAEVASKNTKLNWEARDDRWFPEDEKPDIPLVPGFAEVLEQALLLR